MNPKVFWLITGILLAFVQQAEAQQADKIPRIGFLINSPSVFPGRIGDFRQGLRELGYVEGKNLVIEWRSTEGKLDRAPTLATELVRLKVEFSSRQVRHQLPFSRKRQPPFPL
jgi:putative tryptophan/tyrosine transport system substrate-binding protein